MRYPTTACLFGAVLGLTTHAHAATWYVDTESEIRNAISNAAPGDTIKIKGQTYVLSQRININESGTAGNPIRIDNDGAKVVFDGSNLAEGTPPLAFNGAAYWEVDDIQCQNGNAIYGMLINASHDILITDTYFVGNGDTGVQISNGSYDIEFQRCYSYSNYDPQNNGGNADGFGVKSNSHHVSFYNCYAWNNSDDGWDFWGSRYNTLVECRSYNNGYDTEGNGCGFKLGGNNQSGNHTVYRCLAYNNLSTGFTENSSLHENDIRHCTSYNNLYGFTAYDTDTVIMNCIAYGNANGNYIVSAVNDSYNTWNLSITDPEFVSTSTSSPNFLHLDSTSDCRDAGNNYGQGYSGAAPELGAYEDW